MRFSCWIGFISTLFVLAAAPTVQGQLRVVTYNTLKKPSTSSDASNWNVVLQAIGNESVGGIAKRIGIMALQEVDQASSGQNAKNIANQLNTLYEATSYQSSIGSFGDGFNLQAFVYDTSQVQLVGTLTTDIGTRPTLRGQFRPVGYTSSADFYVYSSHLKAFADQQATRANEAAVLRANGNSLGQGASVIYAGDFNLIGGASEPAYNIMLAAGNGQAIDPENGDFTTLLKKTYSSSSAISRLDFQFISNELADDEGLDLIDSSYHVFGRVPRGQNVMTVPIQLESASDHLPVVADYQLPAMLQAELVAVPQTLTQGNLFNLGLSISNVAPVVAALGADELDYSLSLVGNFGSLLGAATGTDVALGSANLHQIALNTSTPGIKSGTIQITSSSPGVANGTQSFSVMFEVLAAALAGDYNDDGTIDAADFSVWRDTFQSDGATLLNDPTPESVDETDYTYWRDHFGEALGGGSDAALARVPEPATLSMFIAASLGLIVRRTRCGRRLGKPATAIYGRAVVILLIFPLTISARGEKIRIATFNASLSPDAAEGRESLPGRMSKPGDARAERVAEIIQRIDPDILLVNEFNWDADGVGAAEFAKHYLSVGHDAGATGCKSSPISFAYCFLPTGVSSPFNTGIPSGDDLDHNGRPNEAGDSFGFGKFPGQYGMLLLSKFPIKFDEVRTFQYFLWKDMPGRLIPTPFYSPDEIELLRLSSKSHWDIPVDVRGRTVHVLASHPTPPVFDGAEDRNGLRNHDEIRFWCDYVMPGHGGYIYDDKQFVAEGETTPAEPRGGLPAGASFVILGDQNADPVDGDSYHRAINQLLDNPRINSSSVPSSAGGLQATAFQVGAAEKDRTNSIHDTATFGRSGNLRVDYVLPSSDMRIVRSNVFWPGNSDSLFKLVTHGSFPSDHRAVYVDVHLPPVASRDSDNPVEAAK